MKQQTEKHQQINDLGKMPSSVRDSFGLIIGGTGTESDASLTQLGSLKVLVRVLTRARSRHPAPDLVSTLIQQCRNFYRDPDGMRPLILRTIEQIEHKQR